MEYRFLSFSGAISLFAQRSCFLLPQCLLQMEPIFRSEVVDPGLGGLYDSELYLDAFVKVMLILQQSPQGRSAIKISIRDRVGFAERFGGQEEVAGGVWRNRLR